MWVCPSSFTWIPWNFFTEFFDTSHYHHLLPKLISPQAFPLYIHLPDWHLKAPSTQQSPKWTCHSPPDLLFLSCPHAMWFTVLYCPAPNLQGLFSSSSSHMMWNHIDYISTGTSLLNTPPFTLCPWPPAVLVYNHRSDLQHLTLDSGSLLQLSLRQKGQAQPFKRMT